MARPQLAAAIEAGDHLACAVSDLDLAARRRQAPFIDLAQESSLGHAAGADGGEPDLEPIGQLRLAVRCEVAGDGDDIEHIPTWVNGTRGEPVMFYAVGRTTDGGYSMTEPMTVEEMKAYRDRHATAKTKEGRAFGPWIDHFEAMAHKTMIRKLMKLLPKSTELQRAMAQDDSIRLDLSPAAVDAELTHIDGEVEEPADETAPEATE